MRTRANVRQPRRFEPTSRATRRLAPEHYRSCPSTPETTEPLPPSPGFETEEDARAEDALRATQMRQAVPQGAVGWHNIKDVYWREAQRLPHLRRPPIDRAAAGNLLARLEAGVRSGIPSPSLASSMAMRGIRLRVMMALLTAIEGLADAELRTFTIINKKWSFPPEEFDKVDAATIKRQLITHLNRAGVTAIPGFLVAFMHGEFEPISGRYILHFHGVTTAAKAAALDALKGKWGYVRTATRASAIRCPKVKNRKRQVTYLLKSYWPMRAVRDVGGGRMRRDRKGWRIREPHHSQVLLWLDRHALADLTVMTGGWSRRLGGPAAMRDLYFSIFER